MSEKGKDLSKVQQAASMFDELKAQGLKPKEIYAKIAEALSISVRSARGYVWRYQHPEEFKALLDRYYEKKRAKAEEAAKTATEPKKRKKAKKESKA